MCQVHEENIRLQLSWILIYFKCALSSSLTFTKGSYYCVEGFSGSDYVTDLDIRKYVALFVFKVWSNTSWRTFSLWLLYPWLKTEYMALSVATREVIQLKGIYVELEFWEDSVGILYDSQMCIDTCKEYNASWTN